MEGEVLPGLSRGYSRDVGLDSAKWSFLNVRAYVSVACVRWGLQALVRGEERRDSTPSLDYGHSGAWRRGAGVSGWQPTLLAASLWL